jgi:Leucine-rich repeat (LRR) protein
LGKTKHILRLGLAIALLMSFAMPARAQVLDTLALDSIKTYFSIKSAMKNPDQVYKLKLSKKKLTEFPPEILTFKNLNYLDLSKNKISTIPNEIATLKYLQHLDLSKNRIDSFSVAMCSLVNLRNVIVSQNDMEGFPPQIGQLVNLLRLDGWSNNFINFPSEMDEMTKLRWMDLRVIQMNADMQTFIQEQLPNTRIHFSPSCNCSF